MNLRAKHKQPFVGFTFDGIHTSQLGLKVVSQGNRFQDNLGPAFKDVTQQAPGADGTFYWETNDTQKEWPLSLGFEDVTEWELRQIRSWLNSKAFGELIFDEAPYKAYRVKLKSPAQFKYLCFDVEDGTQGASTSEIIHNHELVVENQQSSESTTAQAPAPSKKRVYKGEATLTFVAYWPYAEVVSKYLSQYGEDDFIEEWAEASGLLVKKYDGILACTFSTNDGESFIKTINGIRVFDSESSDWPLGWTTISRAYQKKDRLLLAYDINQNYDSVEFQEYLDSGTTKYLQGEFIRDALSLYFTIPATLPTPPQTSVSFVNTFISNYPDYIYNPGDIESDWTWTLTGPISGGNPTTATLQFYYQDIIGETVTTATCIGEIVLSNFILKSGDEKIEISSKTGLCCGLDSNNSYTSNLYNDYLSTDKFFKIPITTNIYEKSIQDPSYYVETSYGTGCSGEFDYTYYYR